MPAKPDARSFSESTHAVVVGISSYQRSGLKHLPACEKEAAAVAAALISAHTCGVPDTQVHLLLGRAANPSAILRRLQACAASASAGDILLFYFAGHGANSGPSYALLTDEVDPADRGRLTREALVDALSSTKARGVLLILDCCGGARLAENAASYFHSLGKDDFRLLVSASRSGQSSWELPDHGSLFTSRLLRVLRGEERLGQAGAIYFSELFGYLHAGVVADAARIFGGTKEQTPIFAGSHADDPLLFVNRDWTLEQVRVKMRRVLPEDLRKRVTLAIAGPLGVVAIAVGCYWTFLDSHAYFEIRGDSIALVHGYPELSGFGLPRTRWIYAFGVDDLRSDARPLQNRTLVLDARDTPESALLKLLKPAPRGAMHWAMGDRANARKYLLEGASEQGTLAPALVLILPEAVQAGDEDRLEALIRRKDPQSAAQLIPALSKLSPARAVGALRASGASKHVGLTLNLLSEWDGQCTPEVQAWWSETLAEPGANTVYPVIAQATLRTKGCTFPVASTIGAPRRHIRSALSTLRLTDPAGFNTVSETVSNLLMHVQAGPIPSHDTLARLAAFGRHLGKAPCTQWLLNPDLALDQDASIDAGVAAARDCPDARLEAVSGDGHVLLLWKRQGMPDRTVARVELAPAMGGPALAMVEAMVEANATNGPSAMRDMMRASASPELRLALARRLTALGAPAEDIQTYRLPSRPDLDRELLRWLARTHPQQAASHLASFIKQGSDDSRLLGTLAMIPLDDGFKAQLADHLRERSSTHRTMAQTLIGKPEDVLQLLLSPDVTVRAVAAEYLLARADRLAIFRQAKERSLRADPILQDAQRRMRKLDHLIGQLEVTPPWALAWRAQWIDHSQLDDSGMALAFAQALERRWATIRQ